MNNQLVVTLKYQKDLRRLANDINLILNQYQSKLESGQTIKTINGQSILGQGDLPVGGSGGGNSWFLGGW